MPRTLAISAGARTRLFRRRFSSLPQTIKFDADESGGVVERVGSRWIMGRTRSTSPLQLHNEVHKGYWDTFFDIYVTPDRPVRVTIDRPRLARRLLITSLALVVVAIAAALAFKLA